MQHHVAQSERKHSATLNGMLLASKLIIDFKCPKTFEKPFLSTPSFHLIYLLLAYYRYSGLVRSPVLRIKMRQDRARGVTGLCTKHLSLSRACTIGQWGAASTSDAFSNRSQLHKDARVQMGKEVTQKDIGSTSKTSTLGHLISRQACSSVSSDNQRKISRRR